MCLYISVTELLPLCPLFSHSLPDCPAPSFTFSFFSSYLISFFPSLSPYPLSHSHLTVKVSNETLSNRQITHTHGPSCEFKTASNITNEHHATLRSPTFACCSFRVFHLPSSLCPPTPSASISFELRSIKDNPADDAGCTLCSSSEGESQVPQERDCTSSTNEAWGDPNAV